MKYFFCKQAFRAAPSSVLRIWIFLVIFLFSIKGSALRAENAAAYAATVQLPALRWEMEKIIYRLDPNNYRLEEETEGFTHLITNLNSSPFSYDIYLGNISEKIPTAIVRVEAPPGDVKVLIRILELEKMIIKEEVPTESGLPASILDTKSHLISQTLNWTMPWAAVLYNSYHSPRLTSGQTIARFFAYLGADLFLIWAAGRNFFIPYNAERTDLEKLLAMPPNRSTRWSLKENGIDVLAGMIFLRTIGGIQSLNTIRGHNRLVELKYTFYLE